MTVPEVTHRKKHHVSYRKPRWRHDICGGCGKYALVSYLLDEHKRPVTWSRKGGIISLCYLCQPKGDN